MRSVVIYLLNTNRTEVEKLLNQLYQHVDFRHQLDEDRLAKFPDDIRQKLLADNIQWNYQKNDDTFLYIKFYSDFSLELEPEDYQLLVQTLGQAPDVSLLADISNRHSGDEEV